MAAALHQCALHRGGSISSNWRVSRRTASFAPQCATSKAGRGKPNDGDSGQATASSNPPVKAKAQRQRRSSSKTILVSATQDVAAHGTAPSPPALPAAAAPEPDAGKLLTLVLLRHARAEHRGCFEYNTEADKSRELAAKGRKDAARVAKRLHKKLGAPGLVLASPAARALQTAAALRLSGASRLVLDPALYTTAASGVELLPALAAGVAGAARPKKDTLVVAVGHNAGWEQAASHLAGMTVALPTGAAAVLRIRAGSWAEAFAAPGGGGRWRLEDIVLPSKTPKGGEARAAVVVVGGDAAQGGVQGAAQGAEGVPSGGGATSVLSSLSTLAAGIAAAAGAVFVGESPPSPAPLLPPALPPASLRPGPVAVEAGISVPRVRRARRPKDALSSPSPPESSRRGVRGGAVLRAVQTLAAEGPRDAP